MGKQYHLPLVAMVEVMQSSPSRVLLQSQLASLPGVSKKKCLAQVVLEQGIVRACTIWGETGALLGEQQQAYEALATYGDLDWEVIAAPGISPSSGHLNNPPAPSTAPSSGYLRSTPTSGTLPTSGPLPSSGYLHSTPNPDISLVSGYLYSTPTSDTWGNMPAIPRTQNTSWRIPQARVTPLPREILASLPHAHRAVLMLVDGKRSLEEIAQLLHKTPQDIQQILVKLSNVVHM